MTHFYKNDLNITGSSDIFFIADIAANHDNSLSRAIDLIYLAKESGAHAAKFQHFTADTIVSDFGFKALKNINSHQSNWGKSVYEVYREATLSIEWNKALKDACDQAGIIFLTSPYSYDLVDAVDPYVCAYKIGSGDITWIQLIEYIAEKNKPILLATGASTIEDVQRAVDALREKCKEIYLMQCNTNYTGSTENFKYICLNVLKRYRDLFPDVYIGLSDHTPGHATVLGAITLGAKVIEKHFTDSNDRVGPDHAFSMTPRSWREMVDRSLELELALGVEEKKIEANEGATKILQRRSVRAARDLATGEVVTKEMLEVLRPCPDDAIAPYELDDVLGRILNKNISKGDILRWSDLIP